MIGAWLYHWLGISGTGPVYGFWSGFGSDIGQVTLIGAIAGMFVRHNCHRKGCWRIGKHVVNGTPYCSRHHEDARKPPPMGNSHGDPT